MDGDLLILCRARFLCCLLGIVQVACHQCTGSSTTSRTTAEYVGGQCCTWPCMHRRSTSTGAFACQNSRMTTYAALCVTHVCARMMSLRTNTTLYHEMAKYSSSDCVRTDDSISSLPAIKFCSVLVWLEYEIYQRHGRNSLGRDELYLVILTDQDFLHTPPVWDAQASEQHICLCMATAVPNATAAAAFVPPRSC